MFERFDKQARRMVFCARYEASQLGSPTIESEHLLRGLLREGKGRLNLLPGIRPRVKSILAALDAAAVRGAKVPTSVQLPLSDECKRILAYGAEEAGKLNSDTIRIEHLALGILREENCQAARILRDQGLEIEEVRARVAEKSKEEPDILSLEVFVQTLASIFQRRPRKGEKVDSAASKDA